MKGPSNAMKSTIANSLKNADLHSLNCVNRMPPPVNLTEYEELDDLLKDDIFWIQFFM